MIRLGGLDKARTQQQEDTRLWQEHQLPDETLEKGRAEAILQQLASAGVEMAHPVRFQLERISSDYHSDDLLMTSRWCFYPAEAKRDNALLCWRAKDQWQQKQQEHLREGVEAILSSPRKVQCLRLLLAERIMQEQRELIHEIAEEFIEAVALTPKKAAKKAAVELSTVEELDPDHLWHSYEEEKKRLKDYTEQWDEHLSAIHSRGQIFLV